MEVGVGPAGPRHPPASDPVDFAPPGIFHRGDLFVEDPAAELRRLDTLHLIAWNWRESDVEERFRWEVLDANDPLDQTLEPFAMALHMLDVETAVGDRDARDAGGQTLHRRGDGAGIQHVFTHIRAMVHTRDHPVRPC